MPDRAMSVREYAEHRGCATRAVTVALAKKRISRTAEGWIDPVQADIDWAKNTNPRSSEANKRNGAIGQALKRRRLQAASPPLPPEATLRSPQQPALIPQSDD